MESRNRRSDEPITVTVARDNAPVDYRPRIPSASPLPRRSGYQDYDEEPEKTLRDYIRVIFKRKRAISIVFLAVVALTAATHSLAFLFTGLLLRWNLTKRARIRSTISGNR